METTQSQLRKDLCASTCDGAAFSVNVGLGETYLPAFLLAAGGAQVAAGLVATLPLLAGAVLQLLAPRAVAALGSLRRWVMLCAVVQAACFVPLAAAALAGRVPAWLVFLIAACYWGAGMAAGPAWNTWIGTVVPSRVRPHYFANRSRIAQISVLIGLLAGGAVLESGKAAGTPLPAFALIFLAAGICRFTSIVFLARQSEPAVHRLQLRRVSLVEFIRRAKSGRDVHLLLYMLAVGVAANVAAPFFTPYMLGKLEFSYVEYMSLIAVSFVAKYLMYPAVGRFARRFGAARLLWIGAIGVSPLPALWIVSHSFAYLLAIQILAGGMWACYELATFLLTFETIDEEERTSLLTTFNFANAVATVGGSLLGGALLSGFAGLPDAYPVIFAISSVARLMPLVLLFRLAPVSFRALPLALRVLALRPSAGSIDRPVLPSIPKGTMDASGSGERRA